MYINKANNDKGGVCPFTQLFAKHFEFEPKSGQRSRERYCDSPRPLFGGMLCSGIGAQAEECNVQHCPVDGNWATWLPWGICSHSCNGGVRHRQRACDDPVRVRF